MDEVAQYWKRVAEKVHAEHLSILETQRNEIQELQRRCQDLQFERTMMRASNAMDFRDFCLSHANNGSVPLTSILQFLHSASDGLVPPPENPKKRLRESRPPPSPLTRAMQRIMVLNRKIVREGDEEYYTASSATQPPASPSTPGPFILPMSAVAANGSSFQTSCSASGRMPPPTSAPQAGSHAPSSRVR